MRGDCKTPGFSLCCLVVSSLLLAVFIYYMLTLRSFIHSCLLPNEHRNSYRIACSIHTDVVSEVEPFGQHEYTDVLLLR